MSPHGEPTTEALRLRVADILGDIKGADPMLAISALHHIMDVVAEAREEGARLARQQVESAVEALPPVVNSAPWHYIDRAAVLALLAGGAARAGDSPYGWHGNGDLCLGSECGVVDADGDHPMADVHSNDWYEGYEAGQRAGVGDSGGVDVDDLHAADMAASLVHDYIWSKPVLSGTTPPSKDQASDAVWTIHKVLRPIIAALDAAAAPDPLPPDPRPLHPWNDPDGDGHDCADCAPDSMWKCDPAAHLSGPYSLLTEAQRADLQANLEDMARTRRRGNAAAGSIPLGGNADPLPSAPVEEA